MQTSLDKDRGARAVFRCALACMVSGRPGHPGGLEGPGPAADDRSASSALGNDTHCGFP